MDNKTLILVALMVALAITLSMAVIFWTRRTYPGFGYWVAGAACGFLASVLFLLPRDQFPPWLTIVLANYLLLAKGILFLRGTLRFRGRSTRGHWDIAGSLGYVALLLWFSYGDPSLQARIVINGLFNALWMLWLAVVLLTRRPPYFGSADRLQAVLWLVLATGDLGRALYAGFFAPPLTDFLAGPAYQDLWILLLILASFLIALSQVLMNAQRLEYDLRQAREALEEDIAERERIQGALRQAKARL